MKNLKNILSVILAVIIMLTATSTMAYSKTLDVRDEIQISTFISNEKGSIKIANQITGYSLYYQVNEMDNSTYKKIKQLEDELRGCGLNARAIIRTYLNHVGEYGYEDFYHLELVSPKSL